MIIDMLKKVNGSKILPQDTKIIWDLLRIHSFRISNREPYQTIGPMTTQEISTGALLVTHSMPTQTPGLSHHQKDTTIMFAFNLPLKSTWASLSTQVWSQKVSDLTRLNRPPKYPIIGASTILAISTGSLPMILSTLTQMNGSNLPHQPMTLLFRCLLSHSQV